MENPNDLTNDKTGTEEDESRRPGAKKPAPKFPNVNLLLQRYVSKRTVNAPPESEVQDHGEERSANTELNNSTNMNSINGTKTTNFNPEIWFNRMKMINEKGTRVDADKSPTVGNDVNDNGVGNPPNDENQGVDTSAMCGGFGWYPAFLQR